MAGPKTELKERAVLKLKEQVEQGISEEELEELLRVYPVWLRDDIALKVLDIYFRIVQWRFLVLAGKTVKLLLTIPKDEIWRAFREKHGDVPYGVFRHKCYKDRWLILDVIVDHETMDIPYQPPFYIIERIDGEVENLDTVDHRFALALWTTRIKDEIYFRFARLIDDILMRVEKEVVTELKPGW